jgi:hypothetical protein
MTSDPRGFGGAMPGGGAAAPCRIPAMPRIEEFWDIEWPGMEDCGAEWEE